MEYKIYRHHGKSGRRNFLDLEILSSFSLIFFFLLCSCLVLFFLIFLTLTLQLPLFVKKLGQLTRKMALLSLLLCIYKFIKVKCDFVNP